MFTRIYLNSGVVSAGTFCAHLISKSTVSCSDVLKIRPYFYVCVRADSYLHHRNGFLKGVGNLLAKGLFLSLYILIQRGT